MTSMGLKAPVKVLPSRKVRQPWFLFALMVFLLFFYRLVVQSCHLPTHIIDSAFASHAIPSMQAPAQIPSKPLFAAPLDIEEDRQAAAASLSMYWKKPISVKADPEIKRESVPGCLKHIVYDKPVKTGSTSAKFAMVRYLEARWGNTTDTCTGLDGPCVFAPCAYTECNDYAEQFMSGEAEKRSLLGHMFGQDGLIDRLGKNGYYKVTSIRHPQKRWESAYRFNKLMKGNHYGIHHTATYEEFMSRMKPCSLLHYYDRKGPKCGGNVDGRIEKIVSRYDEIIDLYDEPVGQLHKLMMPYLEVENESAPVSLDVNFDIDAVLGNETKLYNALKKRRLELAGYERPIC